MSVSSEKQKYLQTLLEWIDRKITKHSGNGRIVCIIPRVKHRFFKTLWEFSHDDMNGHVWNENNVDIPEFLKEKLPVSLQFVVYKHREAIDQYTDCVTYRYNIEVKSVPIEHNEFLYERIVM